MMMQSPTLSLVPAGVGLKSVLDPQRPRAAGPHQAVQAAAQVPGATLVQS
jgi:hypothetical protein